MFESLDEQIKIDEHKTTTNKELLVRWSLIVVLSIFLFGALYFGLRLINWG